MSALEQSPPCVGQGSGPVSSPHHAAIQHGMEPPSPSPLLPSPRAAGIGSSSHEASDEVPLRFARPRRQYSHRARLFPDESGEPLASRRGLHSAHHASTHTARQPHTDTPHRRAPATDHPAAAANPHRLPPIRVATLNVGSATTRFQIVIDMLMLYDLDVLFLQEVSITRDSRHSFCEAVRRCDPRYKVFFAPADPASRTGSAVCAISRATAVQAEVPSSAPERVLALLVHRAGATPLALIGCYGHASHPQARDCLLQELIAHMRTFDAGVLIGDTNCTAEEGALGRAFASGAVFAADDGFDVPHTTRPAGHRRIDMALHTAGYPPSAREQHPTPSDHDIVIYSFPRGEDVTRRRAPRHRRIDAQRSDEDIDRALTIPPRNPTDTDTWWAQLSAAAETALCAGPVATPRASLWQPAPERGSHPAAPPGQRVHHRRLLRLRRRLTHLARHPHDQHLQRITWRTAQALTPTHPELASPDPQHVASITAALDALIAEEERERELRRLHKWTAEVHTNVAAQRRWIRRARDSADDAPTALFHTQTAVHPRDQIATAQADWAKWWCGDHAAEHNLGRLDELLAAAPAEPASRSEVVFTGENLRRAALRSVRKAPGPDAWRSEDLARLPLRWWSAVAELWQTVWADGVPPHAWARARVVMLAKPSGGYRPLAMTSVIWRAGATVVVRALRGWILTWASASLVGGLPLRGVADALLRVLHKRHTALSAGTGWALISQDLSKCFDSIHIGALARVLAHLGAPPQLATLVTAFYRRLQRAIQIDGVWGEWFGSPHGLLQGCPMSPLLLGTIMQAWTTHVERHSRATLVTYLDDRTFWSDCPLVLLRAKAASDHFDSILGLVTNKSKCQLVASDPATAAACAELPFDYGPAGTRVTTLGATIDLTNSTPAVPARDPYRRTDATLSRIRAATRHVAHRALHIRSIVFPAFTWMSPVIWHVGPAWNEFRKRVDATLHAALPKSTPSLLVRGTAPGGIVDAHHAQQWATLSCLARFELRRLCPPAWHEDLPLDFVSAHIVDYVPGFGRCLAELGWRTMPGTLTRTDHHEQPRYFRFGYDGLGTLRSWLDEHWWKQHFHRTPRIRLNRARRAIEGLAQGLQRPPPPNESVPVPDAHLRWMATRTAYTDSTIAFATGIDVWHCLARLDPGRRGELAGNATTCMCGRDAPSQSHLMWVCPATAHLRKSTEICLPRDRAEDRLLMPSTEPQPTHPHQTDDPVRRTVDILLAARAEGTFLQVATDGGVKEGISAWAIATTRATVADFTPWEDSCAFQAELQALYVLTTALVQAAEALSYTTCVVIYDCKSAGEAAAGTSHLHTRRGFDNHFRHARSTLARHHITLLWGWVPSHGKPCPAGWSPPNHTDERSMRYLNDRADRAVAQKHTEASHSPRSLWARSRTTAAHWATKALMLAARVKEQYAAFLDDGETLPILSLA